MENLNAEQIKKALECCVDGDCYPCPYAEIGAGCRDKMSENALALINSQEQRIGAQDMTISELRQRAEKAEHDARRYEQRIKELTEENERLRGERAKFFEYKHGTSVRNALVLTKNKKEFDEFCEAIKADTVRKMHSEIEARCIKGGIYPAFVKSTIDQIAEEIIGDAKQ